MKRTAIGTCVAVAFTLVASLGAQTTAAPQTRSSAMGDHDISVTGCLQKDASGAYTLANAHIDTSAGTSSSTAASSAGTSAATGTTGMATTPGATWKLEGNTADLDSHVGHKVTITGKEAAASSSSSSSTSTATSTASATGTTGTVAGEEQKSKSESTSSKKLEVKSVKMVSSSCS
jgi:hypothetical protein